MTPEELLKPRYKVITHYPGNNDFPVGKIIEFHPRESSPNYWEHTVEDCQGKRTWLSEFFDQYPSIFKKLEWWENRPSAIVESVKYILDSKTGRIVQVDHFSALFGYMSGVRNCFIAIESERHNPLNSFIDLSSYHIPVTETEYLNYKKINNE